MADEPLMRNLNPYQIFKLLRATEMTTKHERTSVIKQIVFYEPKWTVETIYRGMPAIGAEKDRQNGQYQVIEGALSALSIRTDNPDEAEQEWDLIVNPEQEQQEHHE
jgi:hypothetical protein